MTQADTLRKLIPSFSNYHSSRIHPLYSFERENATCFIKREDETGGLLNGTKRRKYLSLLPFLLSYDEWIIRGSCFSNHVLALSELAKEHHKTVWLIFEDKKPQVSRGNFFLTSLLVEEERMFFEKSDTKWLIDERKKLDKKIIEVPVGGDTKESFLGSLTLPLEIFDQEALQNTHFDHLFIDSGTGFTAAALIAGCNFLKKKTQIHVVLVAGSEAAFQKKVDDANEWLKEAGGLFPFSSSYKTYDSQTAKSFGAVNKKLLSFIESFAKAEGVFLDPIYNAKLFFSAKEIIERDHLQGKILIIHSGGTASLLSFNDLF